MDPSYLLGRYSRWLLGTSETAAQTVPYFAAKLAEERDVAASGLEYTTFRPSFVFGRDGGALPTFMRQVKLSPVVTVIGNGLQRSQPIWVDDVAAIFAKSIDLPEAANRIFELGGPDTVDLTERLPGAPLSVDQVSMIQGADNVVSNTDAVDTFQIPLVSLEEQIRRSA